MNIVYHKKCHSMVNVNIFFMQNHCERSERILTYFMELILAMGQTHILL